MLLVSVYVFFFFNDTATTEIYTLSLHDALPIFIFATSVEYSLDRAYCGAVVNPTWLFTITCTVPPVRYPRSSERFSVSEDRKSTRLNSSHANISYAVFCLKKKKTKYTTTITWHL